MSTPTVSWDKLESAYDFSESGRQTGIEVEAWLDRESGHVFVRCEEFDDEDSESLPDDIDNDDRYMVLPDKRDLDLGQALVWDFVQDRLPHRYEQVRAIFSRRGAYRRFKDLLEREDLLAAWYEHEQQATRQALTAWCEELGVQVVA